MFKRFVDRHLSYSRLVFRFTDLLEATPSEKMTLDIRVPPGWRRGLETQDRLVEQAAGGFLFLAVNCELHPEGLELSPVETIYAIARIE